MKVGDRVVCIKPSPGHLIKGEIYTISAVIDCSCGQRMVAWGEKIFSPSHINCHSCYAYHPTIGEYVGDVGRFRLIDYSIGEKVCEYITKECEKSKTPETV